MSPDDFELVAPHLERVDLPRGLTIIVPDHPIGHAYFPEAGIGSIVAISPKGSRVEAGLFGFDAASPTSITLGSDQTPHEHLIQVAGFGHRIAVDDLHRAAANSPSLTNLLLRYAQTLHVQIAFTALSNAKHGIDVRLARWLLMIHDRHNGDDVRITHEFVSLMLAVRRPSVTSALHVLEGERLIRSERGWVMIRDRDKLEEFAGDAYGKPEGEYQRLIGSMRPPHALS